MRPKGFFAFVGLQKQVLLLSLIALTVGIAFIFLTPPWWHHDEPGHFQVAWFLANRGHAPAVEEYDSEMRVQLANSLNEHGFYAYRNYRLDEQNPAPWIMSPQSSDPKLSYYIYSLPLRLVRSADLADQLILLRFISLFYFISLTLLIYKFALELFPSRSSIAFLAALFFAFLPGAVNQMTAVSNEPLGALLFTAFLFYTRRAVTRQPISRGLLPQFMLAMLVMFTITTVWIIVPFLILTTLLFLSMPARVLRMVGIIFIVLLIALVFIVFENNEARFWYRTNAFESPARTESQIAPNGSYALQLPVIRSIQQRVPEEYGRSLSGANATLGFYAWATETTTFNLEKIIDVKYATLPVVNLQVTSEPTWYSIPLSMDDEIGIIKVKFSAPENENLTSDFAISFSSPTLAAGEHTATPPIFTDDTLSSGTWDGAPFTNLIRNAGLKEVWPRFSLIFNKITAQKLPVGFNQSIVPSVLDPASSGWYFSRTVDSLVKTYWGKLGASNFELVGGTWIYPLYTTLFLIAMITGLFHLWRSRSRINRQILFIFGHTLVIIWVQTILRGASTLEFVKIVIPWSRYASTTFPLISVLLAASAVFTYEYFNRYPILQKAIASLVIGLPLSLVGFAILGQFVFFTKMDAYLRFINPIQIVLLLSICGIGLAPNFNNKLRKIVAF